MSDDCWGQLVEHEDMLDVYDNAESMFSYDVQPWYCPTVLGTVEHDRSRIEHKLGHGGFSTVWLAHDLRTKTDVALKISVAVAANGHLLPERELNEWNIHNEIRRNVQDKSHLLIASKTFTFARPVNPCHHRVLVFPLRGPNIGTCLPSMSMYHRMLATKQILQALKNLHDANIVHRGYKYATYLFDLRLLMALRFKRY